jgi:hypothetical protein
MVNDKIKELEAIKARAAELQALIDRERQSELADLHSKYGYDSLADFIKALKSSAGAAPAAAARGPKKSAAKAAPAPKAAKAAKAAKPAKAAVGGKKARRTRAKITPELKERVKALVGAGKTGSEIASAVGISLPSVQNIKKELGLVKARGK